MSNWMAKWLVFGLGLGMGSGGVAVAQDNEPPVPTRREAHAAQCVAALEVNAEALAQEVKAGREAARTLMQSRIEAGTAFVGDSYLHGTTDEKRARSFSDQALEAQKSLSDAQLAARQQSCADEGAKLLEASNGLERAVVRRFAKKRMDKLLGE